MIKKLLLVFSLFIGTLFANDVNWSVSFYQAKYDAKKEEKLIMVMFTQPDCPACEYMEDIVFDTEEVSDYLNLNYKSVKIDISEKAPMGLKAYGTPTFYFLDKSGKKLGRQFVGGVKKADFLKILKEYKAKAR